MRLTIVFFSVILLWSLSAIDLVISYDSGVNKIGQETFFTFMSVITEEQRSNVVHSIFEEFENVFSQYK